MLTRRARIGGGVKTADPGNDDLEQFGQDSDHFELWGEKIGITKSLSPQISFCDDHYFNTFFVILQVKM